MPVEGTRLYRVKAVAEMFDVSVATIYRAIESGQLGALRIGSRKGAVRVPESAIGVYRKACAASAVRPLSGQAGVATVAGVAVVSGEVG